MADTQWYDTKGMKWVDAASHRRRHCNYMPHTVECSKLAEHKIIETDTGKEFFVCSEHLKNYRDYNERANFEAFTIVF